MNYLKAVCVVDNKLNDKATRNSRQGLVTKISRSSLGWAQSNDVNRYSLRRLRGFLSWLNMEKIFRTGFIKENNMNSKLSQDF